MDQSPPSSIITTATPSPLAMRAEMALARAYFSPVFCGLERLNLKRPALWVGNHTLYGLTDVPLLLEHLYTQHGVLLRALGDRLHYQIPVWNKLLERHGMVLGTRENCAALMQARQHVLVFPGGGREVMRRKGEAYQLIWKQRTGFAAMAMQHGYDIIPFASVGADDNYKILLDGAEITRSTLWRWFAHSLHLDTLTRDGEMLPPLARGIGPSLVPRPQRYYFGFGSRIRTSHLRARANDATAVWALREKVATAVEAQMARMRAYRQSDRQQHWGRLRRLLAPIESP